MTAVESAIAESGERVTISFADEGFAVRKETGGARMLRYVWRAFSGWTLLLGLVVWLAAVYLQGWLRRQEAPSGVTAAFDPIALGAFCYLLLWLAVRGGRAAIREISGYVGLGLLVLVLPLLIVPGCRSWVRRRLSGKAKSIPDLEQAPPGWIPRARVAGVHVSTRRRCTTVVIKYADGARAGYKACGAAGRVLAREFLRVTEPADQISSQSRPSSPT